MTTKLKNLSGAQLRHLRRDWTDKGGYKAVDSGTLAPFHDFIEMVEHFTDGTPIVVGDDGMIEIEPVFDPTLRGFKNSVTISDAAGVALFGLAILAIIGLAAIFSVMEAGW